MFPLMPSQEDKEDEDEEGEPSREKAKRKSPEEGNQPPSDLARHDVIKVKTLGQLHLSHDFKGMHMSSKRRPSRPRAQLHLSGGLSSLIPRDFWPPTCCLGCATC